MSAATDFFPHTLIFQEESWKIEVTIANLLSLELVFKLSLDCHGDPAAAGPPFVLATTGRKVANHGLPLDAVVHEFSKMPSGSCTVTQLPSEACFTWRMRKEDADGVHCASVQPTGILATMTIMMMVPWPLMPCPDCGT